MTPYIARADYFSVATSLLAVEAAAPPLVRRTPASPRTLLDVLDPCCSTPQVRQYFEDGDFYAAELTARDFCDEWSGCEAFSPSSATVKVSPPDVPSWYNGTVLQTSVALEVLQACL